MPQLPPSIQAVDHRAAFPASNLNGYSQLHAQVTNP